MQYVLMHRNISVADLEINESFGRIEEIIDVHVPEHMPVGTMVDGFPNIHRMRGWWNERSIPVSRSGIKDFLDALGFHDSQVLLTKSMGLSLSDQYWIKCAEQAKRWEDVNFFTNPFSDDVGDLLFGHKRSSIDLVSPDNTSNGNLKKRWKIIDGKRCLVKAGSSRMVQEPLNEAVASAIMDRLGINHVHYDAIWDGNLLYSVCEDFVTDSEDLVSAFDIINILPRSECDDLYTHYVKCCDEFGVDIVPSLDRMIVIDYLIGNTDRHTGNFGVVRDAETLEWKGPAPIYDCGSSLCFDVFTENLPGYRPTPCKPFRDSFHDQLMLVSDFSWLDPDSLEAALTDARDVMDRVWVDPAMKNRKDLIMNMVRSNADRIEHFAFSR